MTEQHVHVFTEEAQEKVSGQHNWLHELDAGELAQCSEAQDRALGALRQEVAPAAAIEPTTANQVKIGNELYTATIQHPNLECIIAREPAVEGADGELRANVKLIFRDGSEVDFDGMTLVRTNSLASNTWSKQPSHQEQQLIAA